MCASRLLRPQGAAHWGLHETEPNRIRQFAIDIPARKQVYLYCTCVHEATSARVARILLDKGVQYAVIEGGLRAWKKAACLWSRCQLKKWRQCRRSIRRRGPQHENVRHPLPSR